MGLGEGGGVLDRIYVLDIVHGRSRMTITGGRISAMPGRAFTDQVDIDCLPSSAKRKVRCLRESHDGWAASY